MRYLSRQIEKTILQASGHYPILLLIGPRQCGKTTLLRHLAGKNRPYITLDDLNALTLARNDPDLFLQQYPPPMIIDEIQYAPQLLPVIKRYADAKGKTGLFWLTGSQQFQLMKGVTESMAGRVALLQLHGFSNRERHKRTKETKPFLPGSQKQSQKTPSSQKTTLQGVYADIWRGSMPALLTKPAKERDLFYNSYLATYLQRDVRDLTQVGSITDFTQFLKACAARTGQLLNLSELARDVDISVPTAKQWLSILVASSQIALLEPYHTNVTKRLVKAAKLYFIDTGLCAYLAGWPTSVSLQNGAMAGALLETYVYAELMKSYWYLGKQPTLYYYRDKDGREIDFLIETNGLLHPIEVKRGASISADWIKTFPTIDRMNLKRGPGAVVCFVEKHSLIAKDVFAIPVNDI
ncbi:MAG: ATPase [Elusimicrobia bacterium RIFOXYB2_FULL_49_7]|nr:MAG: ATPase [Elusimicrobia bacterium RIFOXYB2_FULL_49_7]